MLILKVTPHKLRSVVCNVDSFLGYQVVSSSVFVVWHHNGEMFNPYRLRPDMEVSPLNTRLPQGSVQKSDSNRVNISNLPLKAKVNLCAFKAPK